MHGKLMLPLLGGATKLLNPDQLMSYEEHHLETVSREIALCRIQLRERNERGEEELNDYDTTMTAKELKARVRTAFLELGDQESADVFK